MPSDSIVVAEIPPLQPAVEASADAAVEIARIEADAAVTINAQNNEASVEMVTIDAEGEDDVAWLRAELTDLRARCEMNAASLSSVEASMVAVAAQVGEMASGLAQLLASQSTPPLPSDQVPADQVQVTQETTVTGPADALADAADGSRGESVAHAAQPVTEAPRGRRWLR